MNKPTDEELQKAIDVILWVRDNTEKHEPYALNAIAAFDDCIEVMPTSQEELSGG